MTPPAGTASNRNRPARSVSVRNVVPPTSTWAETSGWRDAESVTRPAMDACCARTGVTPHRSAIATIRGWRTGALCMAISSNERLIACGRPTAVGVHRSHPCPTAWANTDGAMWHAPYVLERALHMRIIVRREPETRKSLRQALIREIRVRVGGFCQETVMTEQPSGGAIRALLGRRAGAVGRQHATRAPHVEIECTGQGDEGRGADHQQQQAPALRQTTQFDPGDRSVRQGHRLPAPRQLVPATQAD